jgi:hypothetical protein
MFNLASKDFGEKNGLKGSATPWDQACINNRSELSEN